MWQLCLKLKLCQLMDNELSHILQYLPSFLIWAFLFVFIYKSSYFTWICCHKRHQIDHLQHLNCIMLHHFISVHFMLQECMVQLRRIQLFCLFTSVGVPPGTWKNPTRAQEQHTNWTLKGLNIKPRTFWLWVNCLAPPSHSCHVINSNQTSHFETRPEYTPMFTAYWEIPHTHTCTAFARGCLPPGELQVGFP